MLDKPYNKTTIEEKIKYNNELRSKILEFLDSIPYGYCGGIKCSDCPLDVKIDDISICLETLGYQIKNIKRCNHEM